VSLLIFPSFPTLKKKKIKYPHLFIYLFIFLTCPHKGKGKGGSQPIELPLEDPIYLVSIHIQMYHFLGPSKSCLVYFAICLYYCMFVML
jgi:hypothetical protein